MLEPHWMGDAACRDHSPQLFDAENSRAKDRKEALLICNGCTVQRECRSDALQPINISELLRKYWKVDLDEPDDVVSVNGVIRGGVIIDY